MSSRHTSPRLFVTLPEPLNQRLRTLAERSGQHISEVIRTACAEYLDRRDERRPAVSTQTEATMAECTREEIAATDLRQELESNPGDWDTYRLRHGRTGEVGWLIYSEEHGRAGIAWGGDAAWTDCDSAEDALDRWATGDMIE